MLNCIPDKIARKVDIISMLKFEHPYEEYTQTIVRYSCLSKHW